jgi:hypothetical protein
MTVQINTDNNVEGHARLKVYIAEELGTALARFEISNPFRSASCRRKQ